MKVKIYKEFAQILCNRPDLLERLKPFFNNNLNKNNFIDTKAITDLKSFSQEQLKALYQNEIITKKTFDALISNHQNLENHEYSTNLDERVERILSGDKIEEFQELLDQIDINIIITVKKSFKEVEEMNIPLIEYCVMKKAFKCFKFLLINGKDNPKRVMEEQNPQIAYDKTSRQIKEIKRYK